MAVHSYVSLIPHSSPKNSVSMLLQLMWEANIWIVSLVDLGGQICQNLKALCRKCLSRLQSQLLSVQLTRWWNSSSSTSALANTSSKWCQKPLPFNSREWSRRGTGNLFFSFIAQAGALSSTCTSCIPVIALLVEGYFDSTHLPR